MDGGLIENISVNWAADVDEDNDCLSPKFASGRWGQHGGGLLDASEATISHIQSGGAVKGSGSNIGGVIGSAYDSTISLASSTAKSGWGSTNWWFNWLHEWRKSDLRYCFRLR